MSFTLTKMHNRPENRAETYDPPENPWDGIILELFNDDSIEYSRTKPAGVALEKFLEEFDQNQHPFFRNGAILKSNGRSCARFLLLCRDAGAPVDKMIQATSLGLLLTEMASFLMFCACFISDLASHLLPGLSWLRPV